jgi:mannose-1-phosphate guanylyltransferase
MILAAGLGTRLRPLTERVPKPLVEVAGHPLIAYGFGLLRAAGIRDVVVNLHHRRERVAAALGDGSRFGVRIHYSLEETLLDTGGGIRHAAALLDEIAATDGDPRGPIVIANSDAISEIPVAAVVAFHRERRALVTLALRDDARAEAYGTFGVDHRGRIRRFVGEQRSASDGSGLRDLMFASLHVIDRSVIDRMPSGRAFGTMSELYPGLFRAGEPFFGFVYGGRWLTVDTAEDLANAQAALGRDGLPRYMRDLPVG